MRIRALALIAVGLLMTSSGLAAARSHPSVALAPTSVRAGAPARIAVRADLGAAVTGTLMSYEVDFARGFGFDRRAATTCSGRALRIDTCPASSRIGAGSGQIAVQGPYLPRTGYGVSASLYLAPPQHRGDLAGVLLDLDQNQASLQVALVGRVVGIARGPYGLAIRFSDTTRELPARYHLTLADLELDLGASASAAGTVHSLFTNPIACPRGGWPISVALESGHLRRIFTTITHCS